MEEKIGLVLLSAVYFLVRSVISKWNVGNQIVEAVMYMNGHTFLDLKERLFIFKNDHTGSYFNALNMLNDSILDIFIGLCYLMVGIGLFLYFKEKVSRNVSLYVMILYNVLLAIISSFSYLFNPIVLALSVSNCTSVFPMLLLIIQLNTGYGIGLLCIYDCSFVCLYPFVRRRFSLLVVLLFYCYYYFLPTSSSVLQILDPFTIFKLSYQPNYNPYWYFYTLLFPQFKSSFVVIFAYMLILVASLVKLKYMFGKSPENTIDESITVMLVFLALLSSTTSLHLLLFSFTVVFRDSYHRLSGIMLTFTSIISIFAIILSSTMYYLYVILGSGNANFIYFQTIAVLVCGVVIALQLIKPDNS